LTPYSGSASAYIVAYEGCLEEKGDTPKSSNCQIFTLAPQGTPCHSQPDSSFLCREAFNDPIFDGLTYVWVASEAWPDEDTGRTRLIVNRDYTFYIRAVNNYGSYAATPIEAAFDTRQTGRRLTGVSGASNSTRTLNQVAGHLLYESWSAGPMDTEFVFDAVPYNLCCQVRVTTVAENCESDTISADCCTYIDCPETPQVQCDTDEGSGITASWSDPVGGNGDHVEAWNLVVAETVAGPDMCDSYVGHLTACGVFVPAHGLDGCSLTLGDICGPENSNGDESDTVWHACPLQCDALMLMSEAFLGESLPAGYLPM
jgi:hypothetical protein